MKSKIYSLVVFMMMLCTFITPVSAMDNNPGKETELTEAEIEAKLTVIRERVSEIEAMDKSDMTKSERKALKKELKELNKSAKALGGGVYLSVGAIIIIILLLILIL